MGLIRIWAVLISLVHLGLSEYADDLPYVGYLSTGGQGEDSRSPSGQVTSFVMPYNALSGSEEGYAHGFRVTGDVSGQPYRVLIWRWNHGSWQDDSSWLNRYTTSSQSQLNGYYTVVYKSEEKYSVIGDQYIYLQTAVKVQQNDFIGLSYRTESPVHYDVEESCSHMFTHTMLTSSGYPSERAWYNFDDSANVTECRTYAVGMLVEFADISSDSCQRLNTLDLSTTYTLSSHSGYSTSDYSNDLDVCWLIRSVDSDHYVTFTLDSDSDFELEYYTQCGYDSVMFSVQDGNGFTENGQYCHVNEFPYTREILQEASVVKLSFVTDYSRTARGFRFNYQAVDTTYDPSASSGSASSGASSSGVDCSKTRNEWRWTCLSTTEKVLLICVVVLLFICLVFLIICLVYFCCCRPRDKVEPAPSHAHTEYVMPHAYYENSAIPYKDELPDPVVYGDSVYYKYDENVAIYEELPLASSVKEETVRTEYTYGKPKGLRPLSDPLGQDVDGNQRY